MSRRNYFNFFLLLLLYLSNTEPSDEIAHRVYLSLTILNVAVSRSLLSARIKVRIVFFRELCLESRKATLSEALSVDPSVSPSVTRFSRTANSKKFNGIE